MNTMNDQNDRVGAIQSGPEIPPVPDRTSRRGILRPLPWIVLACSLLITWMAWHYAADAVDLAKNDYFDYRVRAAVARIMRRMETYQTVLIGVQGLFRASERVNRREFKAYVEGLHLEEHYPGIQGVGYSVIVPAAARDRHISEVRKEGFPSYDIHPGGLRNPYTSIVYLEPFSDRNLRAFGYDMYSEPVRRTAMEDARDSGRLAMSGKVRLVQEGGGQEQAGFLLYVPIYRNGSPLTTLAERRANIVGWAYSPFRMNDLIGGIFGEHAGDLDIEIYDGKDATADTLMYDSNGIPSATPARAAALAYNSAIEVAGHSWTVHISALEGLHGRVDSKRPSLIAAAGIAISMLLTWLVWSLMTRHENAVLAVREREALIAELQKALAEIRTLQGILPICSVCKKIRDDKDAWLQMETFISRHSDAVFSHSYCPDCAKKMVDDAKELARKKDR